MKELLPAEDYYGKARHNFEDDDFIDRLNNQWTVRVLMLCIILISGNMFGLKHISCWTPQEFSTAQVEYTNSICFQQGSYYLPTEEIEIPDRSKPRAYYISYYRWTPFVLLGMALSFIFPRLLWNASRRHSGVNISQLVKGIKIDNNKEEGLDVAIRALTLYLKAQKKRHRSMCHSFSCPEFYVGPTIIYFSIKVLYLMNALVQFFLLNYFLSFQFTSYGFEAFEKLRQGQDWFESPRFPRVTMCDFMIRRLGSNQHWYSVQCNLPFNMYNEKIFVGIWLWLIILPILDFLSIISWVFSLTENRRLKAIKRYVKFSRVTPLLSEEKEEKDDKPKQATTPPRMLERTHRDGYQKVPSAQVDVSTRDLGTGDEDSEKKIAEEASALLTYLQLDGYLMFRLITRNTNEIVGAKIIRRLNQELYRERELENVPQQDKLRNTYDTSQTPLTEQSRQNQDTSSV